MYTYIGYRLVDSHENDVNVCTSLFPIKTNRPVVTAITYTQIYTVVDRYYNYTSTIYVIYEHVLPQSRQLFVVAIFLICRLPSAFLDP